MLESTCDLGVMVLAIQKLSLIDLGRISALAMYVRTVRNLEPTDIYKSLFALRSCIRALVDGKGHVSYSNSKLIVSCSRNLWEARVRPLLLST
ncbi:hypothetical protein KFL_003280155 [Klebsormidium nitens]|uniref:Kinesin motor domain-containing protein n=1 Tax=Klebsormidium nitens TaxID=105231 RepID=A0A1Y1ID81_KLENI|nr:hypothetical protein KFL_003280155 [Klebsormidium nitens]|eukprot:GAQ87061.1 hypothetical protein KFL_003280155 [Klebsormidium nitens]